MVLCVYGLNNEQRSAHEKDIDKMFKISRYSNYIATYLGPSVWYYHLCRLQVVTYRTPEWH